MKPANDNGPRRFIAQEAIDVRDLAERLGVDEDRMREFCLEHEEEISQAVGRSALDLVDELARLEGLIPAAEPEGQPGNDWAPLLGLTELAGD